MYASSDFAAKFEYHLVAGICGADEREVVVQDPRDRAV
jgi:hypothetical protein